MRSPQIDIIYERGTLKLPRELPLQERQKVSITIHPPGGIVERACGRLQSTLGREELERAALDSEFDPLEGP